jgi:hypothetical protein
VSLDWSQAFAWRLRRHLLDPVGTETVEGVVRRLGALQAGHELATELAVRTRRKESRAGEVADALADGRIIKTFAFRGATHLMTAEDGGVFLALRSASRMWELPSWQSYYKLAPSDWPALREVVRDGLAGGPLTVKDLVAVIAAPPRFRHLGPILVGNPWNVIKALAWQGILSLGSAQGRSTLQLLDGNRRWAGIPELDAAGTWAVESYLGSYGPATLAHLQYWLGQGLGVGGKRIRAWIDLLGDRIAEVEVGGAPALVRRDDLRDMAAAQASATFRFLPAYDQWVLGPGTSDARIVPAARRSAVSGGANVAILRGVVAGTWSVVDEELRIDWFAESGAPPDDRLDEEVGRLAAILGRSLRASIRKV